MRELIASGDLVQGERLREIPLAAQFGVSRNTVRVAIRILSTEGLAHHEAHCGAVVRVLSEGDIIDIYRVRRTLELESLTLIQSAETSVSESLLGALEACEQAAGSGDYTSFIESELAFHAGLVAHLGSSRLDQLFARVLGELRLVLGRLSADAAPGGAQRIVSLYRRVYDAARRGDIRRSQQLLDEHLLGYEQRLRTELATHVHEDPRRTRRRAARVERAGAREA
jgi:DNA-binding GntR family transcriptional regulator